MISVAFVAIGVGNLVIPDTVHAGLPVDYLVVALGILGAYALFHLHALSTQPGRLILLVFFFSSLVPGIVQATEAEYSQSKLQAFVIAGILLVTPLCLGKIMVPVFRIMTILLVALSTAFSALLLGLGAASASGRITAFGLNPIGIARITAAGAVVALAVLLVRRSARWQTKGLMLVVFALSLIATITTGSRGPLLSSVIACLLMLVALISRRRVSYLWLIALVVAAFFALRILIGDDSSGLDRIVDGSDSGRGSIYADTFSLILAHPLGVGWGNLAAYLPQYVPLGSDILYPHNLFLEMAVEGGWLALVMTVVLVGVALVGALIAVRRSESLWPLVLLGILTYALINAQVSSDVVGNRMMWLYLGFALAFIPARKASIPASRNGSVIDTI